MGSVMILCRIQSVACIARLHRELVGPMGRPEDSAAESCILPLLFLVHICIILAPLGLALNPQKNLPAAIP